MAEERRYDHRMDVRYGHLEVIDLAEVLAGATGPWFNQTLTRVNDAVVRVGRMEGEYHWHRHDVEDEFFFVLRGRLLIDLEDRTLELGPGQGTTVTRGLRHRPRAPEETVVLMVEAATIDPVGLVD